MKTKENFLLLTEVSEHTIDEYLSRGKRKESALWCICGNPKRSKLFKFGSGIEYESLDSYCGNKKCHPLYGIERPAHSKHMSELAKSGSNEKFNETLIKPGELKNKDVNSIKFKKKVLENKEFNLSDNIDDSFSKMLSLRNRSRSVRTRKMLTQYGNWEQRYIDLIMLVTNNVNLTQEYIESLNDLEFEHLRYNIHGISTIRNSDNSKIRRNSWFKSEIMLDLRFNRDGLTSVVTRSGMEAKYIRLFENNSLYWSYETLKIRNMDGRGFYTPDFLVIYEDVTYILETKGSFYRTDKDYYMKNKIKAGIEYAKEQGWKFCLSFDQNPHTPAFLKNTILGDL